MLVASAVPVLDTVMVCGADVVLTVTLPNASDVGDAEMAGAPAATPVPDSAIGMLAPPPVIVYVGLSAATVVGAAGGAYAGNRMASGSSLVWIIGIRYDDGSLATIQQASSPAVRIGDRVRVSNNGMELLPNR